MGLRNEVDGVGTEGYARGAKQYRRVLVALSVVGVSSFAQLYFLQAMIPMMSRDLNVSVADSALTMSAATIGLAASVLIWSWIADRFGRARVMKIALITAGCLGILIPLCPSLETLIVVRVIHGVALGGTPALALTYLSEEVAPRDAAAAAGSYISGTVFGGLAGRLVAAPLAEVFDWRTSSLIVAILCILAAALVIVLLPPAHGFRRPAWRDDNGRHQSVLRAGIVASLRNRSLRVLYLQGALFCGAYVAVYNYLGYRLELAPFGISPAVTSLIFLAGLSGALSSRLAGRLAARFGRRRVMLLSGLMMAVGAGLTVPDHLVVVLIGLLVLTIAYFGAHSIASGWVGAIATTGTAQANSLYSLFYYLGSSVLGWAGGLAFSAGWIGTAIMVVLAVLVALTCAALSPLGKAAPVDSGLPQPNDQKDATEYEEFR